MGAGAGRRACLTTAWVQDRVHNASSGTQVRQVAAPRQAACVVRYLGWKVGGEVGPLGTTSCAPLQKQQARLCFAVPGVDHLDVQAPAVKEVGQAVAVHDLRHSKESGRGPARVAHRTAQEAGSGAAGDAAGSWVRRPEGWALLCPALKCYAQLWRQTTRSGAMGQWQAPALAWSSEETWLTVLLSDLYHLKLR